MKQNKKGGVFCMLELREITAVGIFVRIIVAMLLGGLIGLERGDRKSVV